ncbi:hypothetical protein ACN20G_33655 (plasmid) [Streptomyces sp. BI20]|uniref:hypothetical protein n=1 Tax=Streptomyces sp. BI20 TaxID=3403460 RepID=UPI003C763DF8
MTERQQEDLDLVAADPSARVVRQPDGEVIAGRWWAIPPAASALLLRRGWISRPPHSNAVRVSAAGKAALGWRWARKVGAGRVAVGVIVDGVLDVAQDWTPHP